MLGIYHTELMRSWDKLVTPKQVLRQIVKHADLFTGSSDNLCHEELRDKLMSVAERILWDKSGVKYKSVNRRLILLTYAIKTGKWVTGRPVDVSSHLVKWITTYRGEEISPRTIQNLEEALNSISDLKILNLGSQILDIIRRNSND